MKILRSLLTVLVLSFILVSCDEESTSAPNHQFNDISNITGVWNWIDVDGMICRDGSSTGVGVRFGTNTKKWVIYLQGGGACFTESTCADNEASYGPEDFIRRVEAGSYDGGILNTQRDENPVNDWNMIFVPYCTGDVHSGNSTDSYGLGLSEPQQFVGSRNIQYLLDYLQPYLEASEVDEFMMTGISAGGFGTHLSYYALKQRFPNVKTHLINDSGPLIGDPEVFPPCLLLGFQLIYDLPIPPGYLVCCRPTYGLADIYPFLAMQFPTDNFGLMSHLEDETIRYFFYAGQNTCQGGDISGALFEQGLNHLRDVVLKPTGKWSTYYKPGDDHTFIYGNSRFYDSEVDGKLLYDWIAETMNGVVQHIEP